MARMGDKAQAKAEMRAAGVPLVPGTEGAATSPRRATAAAELGYPVLLKAAAGGGGRGMRLVALGGELDDAYATRLGRGAGGLRRRRRSTSRRRSSPARHVEIQVLCDRFGGVLTLGERECSIQRRHQKLIEESPSPALDAGAARGDGGGGRARLPARSATATPAPSSSCSGPTASFYFIELNARLQVEHPGHRAASPASTSSASSCASPPASGCALTGRAPRARARDRDPPQRRGSVARLRARAGHARRASGRRSARASASTRFVEEGHGDPAATTTR